MNPFFWLLGALGILGGSKPTTPGGYQPIPGPHNPAQPGGAGPSPGGGMPQGMVRPARADEIQLALENRDKIFVTWRSWSPMEYRYGVNIAFFGGGEGTEAARLLVAVERGQLLAGPQLRLEPAPGPARALLDEGRTTMVVCPLNYAPPGAWVEATRTGSYAVRGRLGLQA
jgi:hypothetical protein